MEAEPPNRGGFNFGNYLHLKGEDQNEMKK